MVIHQAIVSSKGQITLPKELREQLNLVEGSRVQFLVRDNGDVRMIPKVRNIVDAAGMLGSPPGGSMSIEAMNEGIRDAAAESGMAGLRRSS